MSGFEVRGFEAGCGLKSSVRAAEAIGERSGSSASRIESLYRHKVSKGRTEAMRKNEPNSISLRSRTWPTPNAQNILILPHTQHNPINLALPLTSHIVPFRANPLANQRPDDFLPNAIGDALAQSEDEATAVDVRRIFPDGLD